MTLVIGETADLPIVLESSKENSIERQLLTIAAGIVIENNPYFLKNQNRFFGNERARENVIEEMDTLLDNRHEDDYEPAVEAAFYNAAYNQYLPKYDADGSRGLEMRNRFRNLLTDKKLIRIVENTDTLTMLEVAANSLNTEDESEYMSGLDEILTSISGFMASHNKNKAQLGFQLLLDEVKSLKHERFGEDVKKKVLTKALKSFKYVIAIERSFPEKLPKGFTRENIFTAFGQEFYMALYGEEYIVEDEGVA